MTMGIQDLEKIFKEQIDSGKGPYMEFDIIRGDTMVRHKHILNEFTSLLPLLRLLEHVKTVDTIPQFTKGDEQ